MKDIVVDGFSATLTINKVKKGYDVVIRIPFIDKDDAEYGLNRLVGEELIRDKEKK